MRYLKKLTMSSSAQQKGNVAIEMAFSLPIFLALILGTLEINRFFWTSYWLDYNLHQAVKDEAWEPGIGVESRLKERLKGLLIDTNKLSIQKKTVSLGVLYLSEFTVNYKTRYFFLPHKDLTLSSSSWLGDNENDII
jgi:hypothetical protein